MLRRAYVLAELLKSIEAMMRGGLSDDLGHGYRSVRSLKGQGPRGGPATGQQAPSRRIRQDATPPWQMHTKRGKFQPPAEDGDTCVLRVSPREDLRPG